MKNNIVILILIFISFSCKKSEVGPQRIDGEPYNKEFGSKVIIGCEGNFGWGNASLSLYNTENKSVTNNLYNIQNNLSMGDVLQSSTLFNGDLYVVVNNSSKIVVLDTANFFSKGTITGLTSPRYFLGISDTKAYVSDLNADAITIVNPITLQITGTIAVSDWTEQMVLHDEKAYVTQKGNNQVLVIDVNTNLITDSITVGKEPNSLVVDAFNNLWVLCSGGIDDLIPELVQINTSNHSVINSLPFSSVFESPNSLQIDTGGVNLFYLNNGLFKQPISATSIEGVPFVSGGSSIYYGFGINPYNNEMYLADAIDYVQAGKVFRYDYSATLIDSFSVGIIPQDFTFLNN